MLLGDKPIFIYGYGVTGMLVGGGLVLVGAGLVAVGGGFVALGSFVGDGGKLDAVGTGFVDVGGIFVAFGVEVRGTFVLDVTVGLEGVFGSLVEGGFILVGVIVLAVCNVGVDPLLVGVGVGVNVAVIKGGAFKVGLLLPTCGVMVEA